MQGLLDNFDFELNKSGSSVKSGVTDLFRNNNLVLGLRPISDHGVILCGLLSYGCRITYDIILTGGSRLNLSYLVINSEP